MARYIRPDHKLARIILGLIVLSAILAYAAYTSPAPAAKSSPSPTPQATSSEQALTTGIRTKTALCQVAGALQDLACTPGAVIPSATTQQICTPGYSASVRNVPESEKNAVYSEYGVKTHVTGQYEVDHLISLELGGSNAIANLWPEAASPTPGFHQKDVVENMLHDEVCSGKITLAVAQKEIATNWLVLYKP